MIVSDGEAWQGKHQFLHDQKIGRPCNICGEPFEDPHEFDKLDNDDIPEVIEIAHRSTCTCRSNSETVGVKYSSLASSES